MFRRFVASRCRYNMKDLIIVRHGQAQHNPRAELAKANGCSMEEFVDLMRQDDVLDATLTPLGREQAQAARLSSHVDLVVSSSLSRALQTADHVHPYPVTRVSLEQFREISGDLLNAKRRTKKELKQDFPNWDLDQIQEEEDTLWTPVMENLEAAAERGYLGFQWLLKRPESTILLVSHGGILRYTMNDHPMVVLRDERTQVGKAVEARFDNCETRRYRLEWQPDTEGDRRPIILTQIDHDF